MNTFSNRRWTSPLLVGVAAAIVIFLVHSSQRADRSQVARTTPSADKAQPSLNCAFYDFMHVRIIAGFDFVVTFSNAREPSFGERSEGSDTTATTVFDAGHRPAWTFGHDDDGTPMITSPDGTTRIVLFGLKINAPGALLFEAGVRSNDYRNLGGECRQVDLGDRARTPTPVP